MRLDLNADVGESFGAYTIGDDAALMASITSASIAAGFHAGDPAVLRKTVRLAKEHGVAIGAHPGFPDRAGFGRREMRIPASELEDVVLYQIAAVAGIASAEGVRLQHVKAHGALYNMAARDQTMAAAIARATAAFDSKLILFGPPNSRLLDEGRRLGLRVAVEAFADRAYRADGSLVPRTQEGSVIHDGDAVVARAIRLATAHAVETIDGATLSIVPDTLCVHGDTPGAVHLAASLRSGLERAGVRVVPFSAD